MSERKNSTEIEPKLPSFQKIIDELATILMSYVDSFGKRENVGSVEKIKIFLEKVPSLPDKIAELFGVDARFFDGEILGQLPTGIEFEKFIANNKDLIDAIVSKKDIFHFVDAIQTILFSATEVLDKDFVSQCLESDLLQTRAYFVLLLAKYSEEEAIDKYARSLRQSLILVINNCYGNIGRRFKMSLPNDEKRYLEQFRDAMKSVKIPGLSFDSDSKGDIKQNGDQDDGIHSKFVDGIPEISAEEPISNVRLVDFHRIPGMSAEDESFMLQLAHLAHDVKIATDLDKFLRDTTNVDKLVEILVGDYFAE